MTLWLATRSGDSSGAGNTVIATEGPMTHFEVKAFAERYLQVAHDQSVCVTAMLGASKPDIIVRWTGNDSVPDGHPSRKKMQWKLAKGRKWRDV